MKAQGFFSRHLKDLCLSRLVYFSSKDTLSWRQHLPHNKNYSEHANNCRSQRFPHHCLLLWSTEYLYLILHHFIWFQFRFFFFLHFYLRFIPIRQRKTTKTKLVLPLKISYFINSDKLFFRFECFNLYRFKPELIIIT